MMKLAVLPLDSRPCTYDFPRQLAEGCGIQVRTPPLAVMDHFKAPSRFEDIHGWLAQSAPGCDAIVVAAEQLVYGGLVASRSSGVEEEEALRRIDTLQGLRRQCPQADIAVASVVMRTTVSTLKKEDQVWWEKVAEYSKAAAGQTPEAAAGKQRLEAEIPPRVLETFLAARRRNHSVNRRAVQLVAEGTINRLVLLQEDSSPTGLHKAEQDALLALAQSLGVAANVHLHCGADEAASALVGRAIAARLGGPPNLGTEWLGGPRPGFVALYEDRPFAENMALYLQTCGLQAVEAARADVVMLVYAPKGAQMDLAMQPNEAICSYTQEELDAFCARAAHWLARGKRVALLDVHHANGGETQLLRRLAQKGLLGQLCGYAGWNTACNSLGTLLGQIQCLPHMGEAAGRAFTTRRLLDDWLYQAVVRRRLDAQLAAAGEDRWSIQNTAAAGAALDELMHRAPELAEVLPQAGAFTAALAWPRTFEARIELEPVFMAEHGGAPSGFCAGQGAFPQA